jgi:hypothetical protein
MTYGFIDDVYFRTDDSGRALFFPSGTPRSAFDRNAPAYLVRDEAERLRLRGGMIWTQRLWRLGAAVALYIVVASIGLLKLEWMALGVVPLLLAGLAHVLIQRRLVLGLEVVSGSYSWREQEPKRPPRRWRWNHWWDLVVAAPLAGVSLVRVLQASERPELLAAWFGVAFFTIIIGNAVFRIAARARSTEGGTT